MFDFKLVNEDVSIYYYPMCSLVDWGGYIQFVGTEYILRSGDNNPERSTDKNKTLIKEKKYSQAVFENSTNHFYYFTYNNVSDFSSGFSIKTVLFFDYYHSDNVEVNNNYTSPFEFVDQVEIKEMKFLYYSKYVYYSIYSNKTLKAYHGVLDITLNKIIFNTDEDIDTFIPYSSNSMLAITKETAYRICFIKDNNGDCIDECSNPYNIILDINGNKCGTECDSGKYLIIPEEVCSLECNNYIYVAIGNKCGLCRDLNITHKYKLINGSECLSEIIDGSEIYNDELFLLVCKRGYMFNGSICIEEKKEDKCNNLDIFKNELLTNISDYINSPHALNGSNCEAKILKSDDIGINDSVKINISEIFLGACPKILKEQYNISDDESLILLIMESAKKENANHFDTNSFLLGIDILLNIFDISGMQLDLSFCQSYIRITHNISNFNEINIKSAKNFAKQGIDVFNASDSFFNDLCHPYDDKDGNDIIIYDRRKNIYQNVTFCQPGCSYSNIDYDLTSVDCLCDSKFLQGNFNNSNKKRENLKQNELFTFKELASTFKKNLLISNVNAVYCYNLVFDKNIIKINIGFYCLIILFLGQIILLAFFLYKRLEHIKLYMISFKITENAENKKNKKKKKISFNNVKKEKIKKRNKKDKINPISSEDKLLYSKNEINDNSKSIKFININKNSKNDDDMNLEEILTLRNNINEQIKKNKKEKNKEVLFESKSNVSPVTKKKSKRKSKKRIFINDINDNNNIENEEINNNNKNEEISLKISKIEEELNGLDYEDMITKDKRSFSRMLWTNFVYSKIILGTFFTENNFNLFVIKLSFFVYTFQISLFLNSFFYSDEYISDAYYNNGVLNFISGLPKSIYSVIVSFIITSLLKLLSNSENKLNKVTKEYNKEKKYEEIINDNLKILRNKLIAYYILVFLFGLIFLYYVASFCAVYRYSQKYWFLGFLESYAINFIIAIIVCFFVTLFRYKSIQKKSKCFFIFSKYAKLLL